MEIYERLYHEMDANNLMADPMFITVGHEGCVGQAKGFIIYNHIGLENIREMLCVMAGPEYGTSLEDIDLKTAAETYLIHYGMGVETLKLLEGKLM